MSWTTTAPSGRTACTRRPTKRWSASHSQDLGRHTLDAVTRSPGDVTPADFPPVYDLVARSAAASCRWTAAGSREREPAAQVRAPASSSSRHEVERLAVEDRGLVLGPAVLGLLAGARRSSRPRARVAGVAPVARERGRGLAQPRPSTPRRTRATPRAAPPLGSRQKLVGDLPDQDVLEGELLLALDDRAVSRAGSGRAARARRAAPRARPLRLRSARAPRARTSCLRPRRRAAARAPRRVARRGARRRFPGSSSAGLAGGR